MTDYSSQIIAWYQAVQFRAPPAANLAVYNAQLNSGSLTEAQVQTSIINDPYTQTIVNPVIREYQAAFGRVPDQAGLSFWVNSVAANPVSGLAALSSNFGASPEFLAEYGVTGSAPVTGNTAFVTALYLNVLGRAPDAAGLAFWTASTATVAQVLQGFAQSPEFTANAAPSIVAYEQLEIAGTPPATGSLLELSAQGVTYNLTTGTDAINVSGNNAHVVGVANEILGATWTPGDTITNSGGFTGATLTVSDAGGVAAGNWNATGPASPTVSGIQTATFNSNEAVTVDTSSGYAGLTSLNINSVSSNGFSGDAITAAATTNVTIVNNSGGVNLDGGNNVTVTNSAGNITIGQTTGAAGTVTVNSTLTGGNAIAVDGGTNVSVTAKGETAGSSIQVGQTTAPTGTVTVSATTASGVSQSIGFINVTGGTTVSVTETATNAAGIAAGGTDNLGGVNVVGTSATTSVTVNQTTAAIAANAVPAIAAVKGVLPVTAAPGVNGVTAVNTVPLQVAKAAVQGVTDGFVNIADANAPNSTTATSAGLGGTIASVTLANYRGADISSAALNSLTLSGTGGTVVTWEGGSTAGANTTLALNVNNLSSAPGFNSAYFDATAQFTTINAVTGASKSTLELFDGALKTLNVSGSSELNLGAAGVAGINQLTALNVSGTAGFKDGATAVGAAGLDLLGAALTITNTSTGTFTAALDAHTQAYTGSAGQSIITINDTLGSTFKAINGGTGTTDELILDGGAYALVASQTAKLSGFETIGVTAAVTGTINLSVLDATASTLDVIGSAAGIAFTKVATGAAVSIDSSTGGVVSVAYVDTTGNSDTSTVTIGKAANAAEISVNALTLQDANSHGIATVNIVSNDSGYDEGAGNVGNAIVTLTDNGLATLTVSGTGGLTINNIIEASTPATSFTLNNTETGVGGVEINALVDNALGSLTFTGTNTSVVDNLATNTSYVTISDTGTHSASVGHLFDGNLVGLTLGANVAFGTNSAVPDAAGFDTSGFTLAAGSDNAHINISLIGAAAGDTDTLTLGNGNNTISDASSTTTATVNITTGTGYNAIDLGNGAQATDSVFNVTLGSHSSTSTLFDAINANNTAGVNVASVANNVVTGAVTGDHVLFGTDAGAVLTNAGLTAGAGTLTATTLSGAGSVAAAIVLLEAAAATQHAVAEGVYGGNTYIVENNAAGTSATHTTVVELVGVHTFTGASGALVLAS